MLHTQHRSLYRIVHDRTNYVLSQLVHPSQSILTLGETTLSLEPYTPTNGMSQPLTRADVEQLMQEVGESAKLDLSWQNMRGIDLSEFDLAGARLDRANLTAANLSEANLRHEPHG